MICPSCHKENDESKKFCTHCGAKLTKIYYCTMCGNILNSDQKFCIKCGTPNPYFTPKQINSNTDKNSTLLNENAANIERSTPYPIFTQPVEQKNAAENRSINEPFEYNIPQYGDSQYCPSDSSINGIAESDKVAVTSETQIEQPSEMIEPIASEEDYSGELPVYEENENISKGASWLVWVIVLLLLGGGVLATGQWLNWWNISALSWIGKSVSSNEAIVAVDSDSIVEEVPVDVDNETQPDVNIVPDMRVLKGSIGEKYAVEMVLSGESVEEGTAHHFRPLTGKYRYTKNNGPWINLVIESATNINGITSIELKEYTDGSLTGTWDVRYDMSENTLQGIMTNYKGDTYSVNLSAGSSKSSLKEGYNKITGNVVTDYKNYPFYIDFHYENGEISNAVYHNPDYNTEYNLNIARISNGEYYFEGDHNNQFMNIKFSATAPYKGTMKVGSNIRNIEMDL